MKKLLWMFVVLWLTVTAVWVHAQSFWSDTLSVKTDTAKECQLVGWTYIHVNKENVCTNISAQLLPKPEQIQISMAAKQLVTLIGSTPSLYIKVMDLLEWYKIGFIQNNDTKRLVIAMLLTQDIKKNVVTVPETCSVRFDGCNTCQIMENGEMACTLMYCAEKEAPKCLQHKDEVAVVIPETCTVRFDGCNTCQIMEDWALACTKMYCAENESPKCLEHTNKDKNKKSNTDEVVVPVPETCAVRFDGCNTCQVLENGEMACTLMYCAEKEEPKCLEHK